MIATVVETPFPVQPLSGRMAEEPLPALPQWLASSIELMGWTIYLGALSVLGSFAFVLCLAVMRG